MNNFVVWGASSTVGAEAVAQLLRRPSVERVWVLDDLNHPETEKLVRRYLDHHHASRQDKLRWLSVDYTEKDAGLTAEFKSLIRTAPVAAILVAQHFDPELTQAELDFFYLQPLKQLRQLFSSSPLSTLHYLSTVFIAGTRDGAFTEFDFDCGQQFRNSFEAAQHRAEAYLRRHFAECLTTVYRLPLVCGHSDSGLTVDAQSLTSAIAELLTHESGIVHGDKEAALPIAPVDHLVQMVVCNLFASDPITGTLHLTGTSLQLPELRARLTRRTASQSVTYRNQVACRLNRSLRSLGRVSGGRSGTESRLHGYLYSYAHYDDYRYLEALKQFDLDRPGRDCIRPLACVQEIAFEPSLTKARKAVASLNLMGVYELEGRQEKVVDDIRIVCWDVGKGAPVLMLSGLLGPESWFGVCKRLKCDYRCVLTSMAGLGPSLPSQREPLGVAEQAALIKGLISHLDIQGPCHLIASDVAAPVLQYFLSRWPERVGSLTYLNPLTLPQEMRELFPLSIRSLLKRRKGQELVRRMVSNMPGFITRALKFTKLIYRPERRTDQRIDLIRQNVSRDAHQFRQFCFTLLNGSNQDVVAELRDTRSPLKIIWSCENPFSSLSRCVRTLDELARRDSIELVAYAGLDVYEEMPDLIATRVHEFIHQAGGALDAPRPAWRPNLPRSLAVSDAGLESPVNKAGKDTKVESRSLRRKARSAAEAVGRLHAKPVTG